MKSHWYWRETAPEGEMFTTWWGEECKFRERCYACEGTGVDWHETCVTCGGEGWVCVAEETQN